MILISFVIGPRVYEYEFDESEFNSRLTDQEIIDYILGFKTLQVNPPGVKSTEWYIRTAQVEALRIERDA